MKLRSLFTLFAGALCVPSFAQITITSNDFPSAGETFVVKQAVDIQLDYTSTGANHTWDFSNLTSINDVTKEHFSMTGAPLLVNMTFGPLALTPYRASYHKAVTDLPLDQVLSILPIQLGDFSQYIKKETSKQTMVGYSVMISGQGVPVKSDTVETQYVFPLNYNDTYSSRGFTDFDLSMVVDAQWVQYRQRNTVVDGWGTIQIPNGSFQVLRVKHTITERDTITFSGNTVGIPVPTRNEYEWLAAGEKMPILKVVTTEIAGNETPVSIEYKDVAASVSLETLAQGGFLVYPNPATEELTVSGATPNDVITVTSLEGKVISEMIASGEYVTFSVAHLQAGVYLVKVQGQATAKIVPFVKK